MIVLPVGGASCDGRSAAPSQHVGQGTISQHPPSPETPAQGKQVIHKRSMSFLPKNNPKFIK